MNGRLLPNREESAVSVRFEPLGPLTGLASPLPSVLDDAILR